MDHYELVKQYFAELDAWENVIRGLGASPPQTSSDLILPAYAGIHLQEQLRAIRPWDFPSPSRRPKKLSRRSLEKRMMAFPLREEFWPRAGGVVSRALPPTDSWSWRKYGQKPIKDSPYPRLKVCPARKQVERCRYDPTMLIIGYSYHHNHPCPLLNISRRENSLSPEPAASVQATSAPRHQLSELGPLGSAVAAQEKYPAEVVAESDSPMMVNDDGGLSTWFPDEIFAAVSGLACSSDAATAEEKYAEVVAESDSLMMVDDGGLSTWFPDEIFAAVSGLAGSSDAAEGSAAPQNTELATEPEEEDQEESLFAGLGELPEYSTMISRLGLSDPEHFDS
ncbi:hypothetical protein Cni_G19892 [Canna indica]|uniref:WRKY domain-containing protein n=1 Tax=Canna indica TaxID=4628 RepID=A0AAQ3QIY7_9LILI|nr:hypothetical protein Cni_G19892 [Canna indica]